MHRANPRSLRLAALAALLAAPLAVASAGPAAAAPTDLSAASVDVGQPTVDESDFAGTPAGEERVTDLAVRYSRPVATLHHAGAAYIKVHFTALRLAPGDHVTVADPSGREIHTYSGDPVRGTAGPGDASYTIHRTRGFAAMSVDGDTAVVTLHRAAASRTPAAVLDRLGYGARIDRFWRGFDAAEIAAQTVGTMAVCGTDARRDVVCYRTSHPTEFARSNAVARLLRNGRGFCTGWRVGRTNRALTNNHCVSTAAAIQSMEVQFEFQCATCGGNNPLPGVKVSGAQMLRTSSALDYTLFSVNSFATIERFGTLFLDVRVARTGERIYIPGHGDAAPKRLSIFDSAQNGPFCTVANPNRGVNIAYNCDTSGGNSGSPVLAASSHRVIALHHLGSCPNNNQGVKIDLVYREISTLIDNTG
jgi:V8-like Glu-specific endopeptidase